MKIIVLIKEVPDMTRVKFNSEKGVVDRSSALAEINPFDENALQAAIDLKEIYPDVTVTALTMGPSTAENSLRIAYAKGADEVVLATDRAFGGSDTFATAKVLETVIEFLGEFDIIITGEKSVDGDTAQVGAEVAEMLNIPHSSYVNKINNISENQVEVTVEDMGNMQQIRSMKLPALISVSKNISKPKLQKLSRKLESLDITVSKVNFQDISDRITEEEVGFKGSPTKVVKIVVPSSEKRNSKIIKDDFKTFEKEVREIFGEKGILR